MAEATHTGFTNVQQAIMDSLAEENSLGLNQPIQLLSTNTKKVYTISATFNQDDTLTEKERFIEGQLIQFTLGKTKGYKPNRNKLHLNIGEKYKVNFTEKELQSELQDLNFQRAALAQNKRLQQQAASEQYDAEDCEEYANYDPIKEHFKTFVYSGIGAPHLVPTVAVKKSLKLATTPHYYNPNESRILVSKKKTPLAQANTNSASSDTKTKMLSDTKTKMPSDAVFNLVDNDDL